MKPSRVGIVNPGHWVEHSSKTSSPYYIPFHFILSIGSAETKVQDDNKQGLEAIHCFSFWGWSGRLQFSSASSHFSSGWTSPNLVPFYKKNYSKDIQCSSAVDAVFSQFLQEELEAKYLVLFCYYRSWDYKKNYNIDIQCSSGYYCSLILQKELQYWYPVLQQVHVHWGCN